MYVKLLFSHGAVMLHPSARRLKKKAIFFSGSLVEARCLWHGFLQGVKERSDYRDLIGRRSMIAVVLEIRVGCL